MTINYTADVATSHSGFGCFWKLVFRWRGSLYKLIWHEFSFYMLLYATLSIVYRLVLSESQKRAFESLVLWVDEAATLLPMTFVLGFYVTLIMERWWNMRLQLPCSDSLAMTMALSVMGKSDVARRLRCTVMRQANLAVALTLSMISPPVRKRFPTMMHMVEMGLMTDEEHSIFKECYSDGSPHDSNVSLPNGGANLPHRELNLPQNSDDLTLNSRKASQKSSNSSLTLNKRFLVYSKSSIEMPYWLPLLWAQQLVETGLNGGYIADSVHVRAVADELGRIRKSCASLLLYDGVCVPLVYTQVVTIAVYAYSLATLVGRQFLDPKQGLPGHSVDLYVPLLTLLQLLFYMGWLKVAESLINPFGEDDDDFDVNALLDRNLLVSYLIVDTLHSRKPPSVDDPFYPLERPQPMPYTRASECYKRTPNRGSATHITLTERQQDIILEEDSSYEDCYDNLGCSNQQLNENHQVFGGSSAQNDVDSIKKVNLENGLKEHDEIRRDSEEDEGVPVEAVKVDMPDSREQQRIQPTRKSLEANKKHKHGISVYALRERRLRRRLQHQDQQNLQ